ncbi:MULTISPECIES: hypothetical protein [Cupriavidus]|uniref:hypothetical protein n=1 Tax=Cupriavidus TaxID=106589 RepID=UPI001F3CBD49|nr:MULTISPECIES: hypothetical protein [Cupriavidus]
MPTMTPLVAARVALVICAFIFLIAFQRRKRLFTVKTGNASSVPPDFDAFVTDLLAENRLTLVLSGFFATLCLVYVVYTLFVPGAA